MNAEQLKAAGFSEAEVSEYQKLQNAGFSEKEVEDYYKQKQQKPPAASTWAAQLKDFLTPTGQTIANIPKDIGRVATGVAETAKVVLPALMPGEAGTMRGRELITGMAGQAAGAGWEGIRQVAPGLVPKPETMHPAVAAGMEATRKGITEPIQKKGFLPFAAETVKEHPVETALNLLPFSKMLTGARTAEQVSQAKNLLHTVRQGYSKGIMSGTEKGKKISAYDKYFDQAANSTVDIVRNKPTLSFVNENGEPVTGRLPKSVGELGQAVAQRESELYKTFHQMAVDAKENGIRINMGRIANALDEIANDPVVRNETPGAARYAAEKAQAYRGQPAQVMRDPTGTPITGPGGAPVTAAGRIVEYDPLQMERAIKIYNQKLAAYQKNPHPDIAKQADIDGRILKMMREDADAAISKAQGPRYSDFKKAYGAHRAVEEDIVRRFNRIVRDAGGKDIVNITDIYSIGEVLTGILTGHPLMLAKGGSFAAAKKMMQWYWSPDHRISQMMNKVEKILEGGGKGGVIRSAAETVGTTAGPSATASRTMPSDEEIEKKIREWLEAGPK